MSQIENPLNLSGQMDAQVWVDKWLETIAENPDIPNDEGTMLGWFANAIMTGFDKAKTEDYMIGRHPNSARFHELLYKAGALHDLKQADYGKDDDPFANVRSTEEWDIPAWVGAMVRLNDKVARLKSLRANGSLKNEAVVDSFMDIAVYALIARVLYEETLKEAIDA